MKTKFHYISLVMFRGASVYVGSVLKIILKDD